MEAVVFNCKGHAGGGGLWSCVEGRPWAGPSFNSDRGVQVATLETAPQCPPHDYGDSGPGSSPFRNRETTSRAVGCLHEVLGVALTRLLRMRYATSRTTGRLFRSG